MPDVFPEPVTKLPMVDVPLEGVRAFLSQSMDHQILFMEFSKDVELPEHSHDSQWGVILEGKIELTVEGVKHTYTKGDRHTWVA